MVWSGTEMIVWGGQTGSSIYARDGWRYDPKTGGWTKFADPPTELLGEAAQSGTNATGHCDAVNTPDMNTPEKSPGPSPLQVTTKSPS